MPFKRDPRNKGKRMWVPKVTPPPPPKLPPIVDEQKKFLDKYDDYLLGIILGNFGEGKTYTAMDGVTFDKYGNRVGQEKEGKFITADPRNCPCSDCTAIREGKQEKLPTPDPKVFIPMYQKGKPFGIETEVLFAAFVKALADGMVEMTRKMEGFGRSMTYVTVAFDDMALITAADNPIDLEESTFEGKCEVCETDLPPRQHVSMAVLEASKEDKMLWFCDTECLQDWIDEQEDEDE